MTKEDRGEEVSDDGWSDACQSFPGKKKRRRMDIIIFYCDDVRGVKIMRIKQYYSQRTALHTLCFVSRY